MTHRVSKRRRVAEAITLALASASCGALFASPVAPKPIPAGQQSLLCAGPVLEKAASGGHSIGLSYGFGAWKLVSVGPENADACVLKATTAAGLYVKFDGGANNRAMLSSDPTFHFTQATGLPPRRFAFTTIEPVLCETYYTGGSGLLSLTITDPNGRTQSFGGVESFTYKPPVAGDDTSARFTPVSVQAAHGAQTQCHAVPYATLAAGAADVPAPGLALTTSIFDSGFEVPVAPSQKADLRVEILDGNGSASNAYLRRNLQATIDQPVQYSIRVRNAGPVAASGIRLKEFVVDTGAPAAQLEPKVEALAWTCVDRGPGVLQSAPGTACTGGSGVLNVGGAGFSLAAGASRTYTLTRTFPSELNTNPNAEQGDLSVLAAAVFFNPADATGKGDVSLEENLAAAIFQLTENPGPTIACAGLNNLTLSESPSPQSFPYSCTVSDTDGIKSFTATSSDNSKVTATVGAPTGNVYPLTLQVPASTFTTAPVTVTLNALDNLDAAATPLAVTVTVNEVNDPPIMDRLHDALQLSPSGGLPRAGDGTTQVPATRTGCLTGGAGQGECQILIRDFFAVSPGVGESGQTLTAMSVQCQEEAGSPIPEAIFTQLPHIVPDDSVPPVVGAFDLRFAYDKALPESTQIRCSFQFQDNGTPAESSGTGPDSEVLFTRFAES